MRRLRRGLGGNVNAESATARGVDEPAGITNTCRWNQAGDVNE